MILAVICKSGRGLALELGSNILNYTYTSYIPRVYCYSSVILADLL